MSTLQQMVQSELEAAQEAGKCALLYMRKEIGRPADAGALARFAVSFAVRALYWQSGQERRDAVEHLVLTQHRFANPATPESRAQWREEDREYFKRKAWDWFNSAPLEEIPLPSDSTVVL